VLRNILIIVYVAVGLFVANSHHYFSHLNSLTSVLSALLAVVLWPLILLGVNLHITSKEHHMHPTLAASLLPPSSAAAQCPSSGSSASS